MAAVNPAFHEDGEIGVEKPSAPEIEFDEIIYQPNGAMAKFARIRDAPFQMLARHSRITSGLIYLSLFGLYNAYYIGCLVRYIKNDLEFAWCDGFGFLTILTAIVYTGLIYYQLFVPFLGKSFNQYVINPIANIVNRIFSYWIVSVLFGLAVLGGIITFVVLDADGENERLISLAGVGILLLIGFICSAHPGAVRWRSVFWGIGIEFFFGFLVLRWPPGREVFQCLGDRVSVFLSYADAGSSFVYGYLVTGVNYVPTNSTSPIELPPLALYGVFAFKTLSVIYFFSFCVSMLFYLGALQWVVMKMGWLLSITVGTTAAESLNAAANIFLGQTEAPLLIKPFLALMTKSEIHAVMTGGFATIAGTVLAAYIDFGIDASQLISASVMAAPTALAFSKLFYPETEISKTTIDQIKIEKGTEANVLDAAAQGASTAVMLVLNIAASLIAFLSFVAFLNAVIAWLGDMSGVEVDTEDGRLSFEFILGKIFIPLAFIMGVPSQDCEKVGRLIGLKTIVNEFAAYQRLGQMTELTKRSKAIATFALCGFANPGSIGIQLGGLGALAPERKTDLAQVVLRAFIAGCMTSFLNACVAGTLISTNS